LSRSSSPSQFSFSSLEYSLKSQPSFHSLKVLLIALESSIYIFQSLKVKKGKFSRDWPSKRVFFRIVAPRRCVPSAAALDGKIRGRQNVGHSARCTISAGFQRCGAANWRQNATHSAQMSCSVTFQRQNATNGRLNAMFAVFFITNCPKPSKS